MYEPLQLPPRPPMTDPTYGPFVQRAGDEVRAAKPWCLVQLEPWLGEPLLVAKRRTAVMRLVTWARNLWRRPRRWWLGRVRLAYEARNRARLG